MYIISLKYLLYMRFVRYAVHMTAPKTEHQARIADARNALADVINRARYADEPTYLINRGKRVAAVVSAEWYERAKAALGEERITTPLP